MNYSTYVVIGLPLAALLAACATTRAPGQAVPAPVPRPAPCVAVEYRQFDFWLGRWEVSDPAGKVVGHNRIETAHGGCALLEKWTSVAGVTGTSLNIYDRDRRQWHQTWVDSGGGLLQLDGARGDSAMVLSGDAFDADAPNKTARQRITWTPHADGSVRQLWESSTDGGKTWTVAFDGRYVRRQ